MKTKQGYLLREVAGSHVVVPVGNATLDFNGMITLNATGAFLWKVLAEGAEEASLVNALCGEYEIDQKTAQQDVACFLAKLKEADLFE